MPSSLFGILNIARSGMAAQQLQLEVASQNLANASTEGYSRQRVELSARRPLFMPEGMLGTGVEVSNISRSRDLLLDRQVRTSTSDLMGDQMRFDLLSGVESLIDEPAGAGLGTTLDAFYSAWSDLANDPTGVGTRSVLVERGRQVADHLNRLSGGLDNLRTTSIDRLSGDVTRANQLLGEVARLNREIVAAEANGNSAPDLGDQRDRALDALSGILDIQVHPQARGAMNVTVGGISVVGESTAQTLSLVGGSGTWSIQTSGGSTLAAPGGTAGASLRILQQDEPAFRASLDDLARGIAESVNAIHSTGTNSNGTTGIDFFDVTGGLANITAGTLSLDAQILADSSNVSAGTADGGGAYQPGANDVALSLAGLRTSGTPGYLGGGTAGDAYRSFVTEVGLAVNGAATDVAAGESLRAVALERRESLVGVSTDEELVKVIQFQAAYAASARIVNVVDEMLQTLLSIV